MNLRTLARASATRHHQRDGLGQPVTQPTVLTTTVRRTRGGVDSQSDSHGGGMDPARTARYRTAFTNGTGSIPPVLRRRHNRRRGTIPLSVASSGSILREAARCDAARVRSLRLGPGCGGGRPRRWLRLPNSRLSTAGVRSIGVGAFRHGPPIASSQPMIWATSAMIAARYAHQSRLSSG